MDTHDSHVRFPNSLARHGRIRPGPTMGDRFLQARFVSSPFVQGRFWQALALLVVAAVTLPAGPATADPPPLAYESIIDGYYLASGRGLAADGEGNVYLIARTIGDYEQNNLLIAGLDPNGDPMWEYYFDGSDHDYATGITLDAGGDVWVTGWTDSPGFPVTADAYQPTRAGFREVFVMKLAASDGSLLYSTYLGGEYTDMGGGIAIGPAGNIYLAGSTASMEFPTVDPYQAELNGHSYAFTDAFVAILSADGSDLLYSTYFGGSEDDWAYAIERGEDGAIHFAGTTQSVDLPLASPVQGAFAGVSDLFLCSLTPEGSALSFGTYLGGEDVDRFGGLTADAAGALYLGGITRSIGYPTTPGAFQEEFVGEVDGCEIPFGGSYNCEDMCVSKIDAGNLIYSTFVGGSSPEECRDVAVSSTGEVYLVGYTSSGDFPPAGIDTASEIALVKLSSDGSELLYSLTIDSGSSNAGHGVATNAAGDVFFTGAIHVPADVYVAKIEDDFVAGAPGDAPGRRASGLRLQASAPNPFANTTHLTFHLPESASGSATLAVLDVTGRRVRTLLSGARAAGPHTVAWDGTDARGQAVPAGVYYYRLAYDGQTRSQPVLLVR